MADLGILANSGAPPKKQSSSVPVSTQTFFTGLVLQRSAFNNLDNRYNRRFLGGRPDQLLGGLNMEVSNYGTLIRRPGTILFTNQTLPTPILSFFSFHQFSTANQAGSITVIADTATEVDAITPVSKTLIFTKSIGAGQAYFQNVGNILYIGDGIDLLAWDGQNPARNWGISIGSVNNAVGPNLAGNGVNDGLGGTAWVNPNNVSSAVSYATVALNVVPHLSAVSQNDLATQFGFSIPLTTTITGIAVEVDTICDTFNNATAFNLRLISNGSPIGLLKSQNVLSTSPTTFILGGNADLWGAVLNANTISQSNFGVEISAVARQPLPPPLNTATYTANFSIRNVRIIVYGNGGPSGTPTGSGGLSTVNGGWSYEIAYGNSASGHVSSPTPPGAYTGNFGGGVNSATILAAGTGYIANDTGIFVSGNLNGTYKVLTVGGGGTVLTFSITAIGSGYGVKNGIATSNAGAQPGIGTGLAFNITSVTGVASVNVPVTASLDPQVNQIWVFRTKDGGATYFNLPTSPYPNTTTTIVDTSTDAGLNTLIIAPGLQTNNPPPAGLVKMTFHLNRIWGATGSFVYYSGGPDTLLGNGNEAFPQANFFQFPEQVNRLVPTGNGLLVFTTDNVFLIAGVNTATFFTVPFQPGIGLLSWNALDFVGSNYYLYTTDRRFIELSSGGFEELGFMIGTALQANFDPALVYVSVLASGTTDQAIFIADGISNWYRCNPAQMPEGTPAWSPLATITGGATAVVNVETSPGNHQLLIGTSTGHVLTRTFSAFTDNGEPYAANVSLGSVVFVQPGQLAEIESVSTECTAIGNQPRLGVRLEEIAGPFEDIPVFVNDPPGLTPSVSVISNRFYLDQGERSIDCRHMQLLLTFSPTGATMDELLTLSIYGSMSLKD